MQIKLDRISHKFLVNSMIPSLISDQLFNLTLLGAFLFTRKRTLLKTYTQNKLSFFSKYMLKYQKQMKINDSVKYLQLAVKFIIANLIICSILKMSQQALNLKQSFKIQEFVKPIIFSTIFKLNYSVGIGLGLINFGIKHLISHNLKNFM